MSAETSSRIVALILPSRYLISSNILPVPALTVSTSRSFIRAKGRTVDRNAVHSAFKLYVDAAVSVSTPDRYVSSRIRLNVISVYQSMHRQSIAN